MTSIHPRWHATDSDSHEEQPVRIVHAAPKKEQRSTPSVASKSVSRRPAAMVGIALTAMIGFAMVQGITTLRGALTSSTGTEVHLTKDGAVPPVITVMPGEQLTWINDDEIPHILSSDTLKMENGLLDSPAIFPGATYTETVAPDAAVKTHDYYSKTSSLVSGQVIVTAGNGTLPDPVSASSAGNTGVSSFSNTQIPVLGDGHGRIVFFGSGNHGNSLLRTLASRDGSAEQPLHGRLRRAGPGIHPTCERATHHHE